MMMIKIQVSRMRGYASVALMAMGTIGLTSTVCAYSSSIPAGDVSYQWLWCGWASAFWAVCTILATLLSLEGVRCFHHSVVWGLILMGGIEAVWGLRQIYGLATSNHSLYAVTGSFYNPGPYSGYLALIFPVCLYEWLRLGAVGQRTRIEEAGYYFSAGVLFLLLSVLPAGMSRSAWLAAIFSGAFVCGAHYSWREWLRQGWKAQRAKVMVVGMVLSIALITGSIGIYHVKTDSAKGRLFIWKISSLAMAEKPVWGHGFGNFLYAYGQSQEAYFAKGDYREDEEWVAGSPEYAFNEYLRIVVECGIPVLLLMLAVVGGGLHRGIRRKRIGICGGFVSLLVFSFSSYPMTYPCFIVTFLFLLVACLWESSRKWMFVFALVAGISGGWLVWHNVYDACREWSQCKMLYGVQAYSRAKAEYERLYPLLKDRSRFLFEYGRCLHNLKEYDASNQILQEAERISNDPMILNIIGKNYQALKRYKEAEHWLLRSTHRLPGRIYPYYLLAKLYAEPDFQNLDKLECMIETVLIKEPKVQSTAVNEMREEVLKIRGNIAQFKF